MPWWKAKNDLATIILGPNEMFWKEKKKIKNWLTPINLKPKMKLT